MVLYFGYDLIFKHKIWCNFILFRFAVLFMTSGGWIFADCEFLLVFFSHANASIYHIKSKYLLSFSTEHVFHWSQPHCAYRWGKYAFSSCCRFRRCYCCSSTHSIFIFLQFQSSVSHTLHTHTQFVSLCFSSSSRFSPSPFAFCMCAISYL